MCPLSEPYVLFWTAALLYAVTAVAAVWRMARQNLPLSPVHVCLLLGGFTVQSLALFMRGHERGAFPLSNPFETLQAVSWGMVCLTLFLKSSARLRMLNCFTAIFAAVVCLLSLALPAWDYPVAASPVSMDPWVKFHAVLAITSYALFGLLAITSLMFVLQNHALRHKHFGGIFAMLPPLRHIEGFSYWLLRIGYGLLSLSVGIGLLNWFVQPTDLGLTKLLTAAVVWGAYSVLLWMRNSPRFHALDCARMALVLFVVVLLSLGTLTRPHKRVGKAALGLGRQSTKADLHRWMQPAATKCPGSADTLFVS
jgi:ABC-type uncharacterized transport system permease subunit